MQNTKSLSLTVQKWHRRLKLVRIPLNALLRGHFLMRGGGGGARAVRNTAEENHLVVWVTEKANVGYGCSKPELWHTMNTILNNEGRNALN